MGRTSDARHREAVFGQLSAELLRSARDESTLRNATTRALHHPDVQSDPTLAGMVRGVIAQCEAELHARLEEQRAEVAGFHLQPGSASRAAQPTFAAAAAPPPDPAVVQAQIQAGFERLRHEFEERLLRYDMAAARESLKKLEHYQQTHADTIMPGQLERCKSDQERVEQRRQQFDEEVSALVEKACVAARKGQHDVVGQHLRKLSSIHASRPQLLSEARFKAIRDQIVASSEHFEHKQVAQQLMARERLVADEIRKLAEGIHRFHVASRELPHDDERYRAAEAEYHLLVRELRSHDMNWLADLMVELDEMLEDLHDNSGQAEAQVARFLDRVRTALRTIIAEVREIAGEISTPAATNPGTPINPNSSPPSSGPPRH